ncbi:MAG: GNAT family N-acetyltransferase [Geminicoccaceae bacterium]
MPIIRFARAEESDACARILREAWRHMPFVPQDLHTHSEDRRWMRDVFAHQIVVVSDTEETGDTSSGTTSLAGFLTMSDGTVHNLYVRPGHQRQGIGHALIEAAKESSAGELKLWVFEPNTSAIRFYERHGFVTIRKTDGRSNEENVPDRLMAWQEQHYRRS